MASHVDILDQPDRLSGWLMGSLAMHLSIAGALAWYMFVGPGKTFKIGSPNPGGFGSVAVNPVARIPLPSNAGPQNPVANDTKSMVPTPPPKPKAQPKPQAKQPDLNAIPLKSRMAKQSKPTYAAENKFREKQKDLPNQVYSNSGQALSNPMYAVKGGGQLGVGENSPFGTQFGWYAERLIDQVGQHWNQAGLDPRSRAASVVFTIHRDGTVTGVRLSMSSGNMGMDLSAQRAVMDAAPFPPLPPGFPKSDATVELKFVLQ
jgi:protein TonB